MDPAVWTAPASVGIGPSGASPIRYTYHWTTHHWTPNIWNAAAIGAAMKARTAAASDQDNVR